MDEASTAYNKQCRRWQAVMTALFPTEGSLERRKSGTLQQQTKLFPGTASKGPPTSTGGAQPPNIYTLKGNYYCNSSSHTESLHAYLVAKGIAIYETANRLTSLDSVMSGLIAKLGLASVQQARLIVFFFAFRKFCQTA